MAKDISVLIDNAAQGDMDALGKLYDTLSVRIFNYARAITKNKEAAEDITHDVFIQILKQSVHLARMVNPIAYIMVATRNQAYDHLKRGKRTNVSFDDIPEEKAVSIPYGQLLIEDALSRLPVNQRETVYLHHVCGFTQKEVAAIMNVPLVTVKWRCGKAKTQLQTYFKQGEGETSNEVL